MFASGTLSETTKHAPLSRAVLVALAFTITQPAVCQETGRIAGEVLDPSGVPVPGAQVEARATGTGVASSSLTSVTGQFLFTALRPGAYELTATADGFKRTVHKNIAVRVGDTVPVAMRLEIGDRAESITVFGGNSTLDTASSTVSTVLGDRLIHTLPINQRNPFSFSSLAAAVIPSRTSVPVGAYSNNFQISGNRGMSNEVYVDGSPATVTEGGIGSLRATVETRTLEGVEEFRVQTGTAAAEFGGSGGIVNLSTRSGSNDLHGVIFEFARDSALDANGFFNNLRGLQLESFQRHQFGGAASGPFRLGRKKAENRTFWFASAEFLRASTTALYSATVPSQAMRAGDFTSVLGLSTQIVNPCNGQAVRSGQIFNPFSVHVIGGQFCRDPFPQNLIPVGLQNPVGRKVLDQFPAPNGQGSLFNYNRAQVVKTRDPRGEVRIDHFANAGRFFLSGTLQRQSTTYDNAFGNAAYVPPDVATNPWVARLGYERAFGPRWLTEFRYAHTFITSILSPAPGYDIRALGFPDAVRKGLQVPAYPAFAFAGLASQGPIGNINQRQSMDSVSGSVTRVSGSHALKFGGMARHEYARRLMIFGMGFSFSSQWTQVNGTVPAGGNPFASALLGLPNNGSTASPVPDGGNAVNTDNHSHHWNHAWFVQDDWRVTRRLTLNLGLRWDLQLPMAENDNLFSWFDPDVPSPLAARVPGVKGIAVFATPDRRNHFLRNTRDFAPRAGLAYRIGDRTVLRSGYGIFYGQNMWQATPTIGIRGPGFLGFTPYAGTLDGETPFPGFNLSNPFPFGFLLPVGLGGQPGPNADLGLLMFYASAKSPTPRIQQWNFGLQRQIGQALILKATYQGASSANLVDRTYNINQLRADQLGPQTLAPVANPFFGVMPLSPLALPQIPAGQLLRPFPQYIAVTLINPTIASSSYHSMLLEASHRYRNGLTLLAAYTASKLIDSNSGAAFYLDNPSAHQDHYRLNADRAISDNDVPQRLVVSAVYELPWGRKQRWIGGWILSGILALQKGTPLSMSMLQNTSFSGSGVLRPNAVARCSGNLPGSPQSRLTRYFDTACFATPAPFTFGNAPRTQPDLRGPGMRSLDVAIHKRFQVSDRLAVEVRAEAFNVSNTPFFANPLTVLGSPLAGQLFATLGQPRQIQMGGRAAF
ncbi:MAG: TonB-dependent receptor [Bryobacteraceae bacterium]